MSVQSPGSRTEKSPSRIAWRPESRMRRAEEALPTLPLVRVFARAMPLLFIACSCGTRVFGWREPRLSLRRHPQQLEKTLGRLPGGPTAVILVDRSAEWNGVLAHPPRRGASGSD